MVAMVFGSFSPLVAFPITAAAIAPVSIFSDTFGTTNVNTVTGWDVDPHNDDATITSGSGDDTAISGSDTKFAKIQRGARICKEIDATGFENLTLSYNWRGDGDAESSDHGVVSYKLGSTNCDSGTGSWTQLQSHGLDSHSSWNTQSAFSLPASSDNAVFTIRFLDDSNANDEYFRVDNVNVDGLAIPAADVTAPSLPTHLSPADGSTLTSAALTDIDWTDVTDPSSPVTYYYQSSNSSATNPDGSFVTPIYNSGALSSSHIPASGTPNGLYYWHVRAVDNVGNSSAWTTAWSITVADTPACSSDDTTFDTFSLGNVNGQHSWSSTGPYDQAIVDNTYGYSTFGCKSLRLSNAVTSGSFGDQTFSYSNANEAGEAVSTNGGQSGGTRQNHFEAQFDLGSTMASQQPGLAVSVSPDRGDGSRMSYVRFVDDTNGIDVYFDDVQGTTNPANFVETQVANDLSRTAPHTIKFVMDFVNGPSNDVVKLYIDGNLVHTGTSWENYYRFDTEASAEQTPRTTDSLIFRAAGTAAPATSGNGFLFDNMSLSSSIVPGAIEITKYECPTDTVVTRAENGVGGSVPEGCTPQSGATFGYVHGSQTDANAPYPELSASMTEAGATNGSGVLTISDLPADGRYLIAETDGAGTKLPYPGSDVLGLYCIGDGDTSGNNDNQELTFVPANGTVSCVAYNKTTFVPQTELRVNIYKYVDGAPATAGTFPMHASWSSSNIGSGSGNYSLTSSGFATTTPYAAMTSAMSVPADYSTNEITGGNIAAPGDETCPINGYRLVGYRYGTTLAAALAAEDTTEVPAFTDLTTDMYVIVDNVTCNCNEEASQTIVSNTATQVDGHDAFVATPHPAWTASIPGASWIWDVAENAATDSVAVGTKVFSRSFTIDGTPTGATLSIASDNTYSVSVNGVLVANSSADLNHFSAAETVNIPASVLLPGANEIEISVNNPTWDGQNPAGLLYSLTVNNNECVTPQVKVHILKYLYDGESTVMANSESTDSTSFPMHASWSSSNIGTSAGDYSLSVVGYATSTAYAADTAAMNYPADYATNEITGNDTDVLPIGAMCTPGKYRLEGYKVGNTLSEAEAADISTDAPSFTDLQQDKYVIVVNRDCDTMPTATVTMCKYDTSANALAGWTLMLKGAHVEDVNVPTNTSLGANTLNVLVSGVSYIATAVGTWLNRTGGEIPNPVDAEYSTTDNWATHMDGYTGYQSDILELQINNAFDPNSDWGAYNSAHIYAQAFTGTGALTNFRVFDGSGTTPNTGWYPDNSGSLDVSIDQGFAGITGENGCVTFNNVPYGAYTTDEVAQSGWENVAGLEEVTVDQPEETFNVVNHDTSTDIEGPTLTIVKQVEGQDGTFTFNVSGELATSTEVTTEEGSGYSLTIPLAVGTSTVTESVPEGWTLASSYCEYGEESAGIPTENGEEIYVEGTDHVTCHFYNEQTGPTETSVNIVVHPGDMSTSTTHVPDMASQWFFYNDQTDVIDNTLGAFVTGPGAVPLGVGDVQISVTGTERRNLATYQFAGTPLSEITAMQFSTYNPSAGNGGSADRSAYLNFNVDFDGSNTWQKRIAFVPSQNGSVTQNMWDQWDAINGGAAQYSYSGSVWPGTATPGTTLRTWSDITSSYPSARILPSDGWLGMRVGEPYADGYTENLDRFLITVNDGSNATTTTFDFEPRQSTETTITNATDLENNSSVVGAPFTVQWNVTALSGTPTGTVEVTANGGAGCTASVGAGECDITPGSTGGIILVAHYSGDTGYDASASDEVLHQVVAGGGDGPSVTPQSFSPSNGGFGFGGDFGGGFGGSVLGASTSTVDYGAQCERYLTDFIKPGANNDPTQVSRLQYVLAILEGLAVPQNGVYDAATITGVHAFQTRYASQILSPWGISKSTGFVYLTTRKLLNEVYCNGKALFPLTAGEQAIIDASRNKGHVTTSTGGGSSNPTSVTTDTTGSTTGEQDSGQGSQTAAAAESTKPSTSGNWWDAIKAFFGFK